ncbi:MAG: PSD1 domain-containing protein [Acidobacteria bacterium]|nr:PSD1 domain-containing protein [Acidobacteriota bacterium]
MNGTRRLKILFCLIASAAALRAQGVPASSPDFFENKIRPLLVNNCNGCHTESALGGLRLDSEAALLKGGKRGPAVVPGDPDKSLLVQAVRQTDANLKMPLGNKLKNEDIENLAAWVKAGARWPVAQALKADVKGGQFSPERKNFWSFAPLSEAKPPAVKDPRWAKTDIDKFILARLEKEGLRPVKTAGKRDLLRRATLDLTGLPPTHDEIIAFEKDLSPDAFAKVVDRLLASPQYGERWGRIWLDVARYGEDDYRSLDPMRRGYNPYPNAYLYRDWVIQAMNDDMPYDMFVKAQLAGDQLDEKVRYKTVAATGFLGLGPWYYDNGAVEVTRADERHDRVDVITRGFLGLTVGCARCHDHKYDPIRTADYYSLAGVFLNTAYTEQPMVPKSVLDKYKSIEEQIEKKQKMLAEMQSNLGMQLSHSLAFRTSDYLEGVWEVKGQKKEMATVVDARRLDFELLDRWIRYMDKPTAKYDFKKPCQEMMKTASAKDGAKQAKKLAGEFQAEVMRVMLMKKDLAEENEIIAAKALEGTKKKKRANKPNEFITNDDFCPGCGLQLKNMAEKDMNFWTEIFQRELSDTDDPNAMMAMGGRMGKPGVLAFRGWGLESRVGSEAQVQLAAIKSDIDAARKKLDPYYPFAHAVRDLESARNLPISVRGNPENLGPEVPRQFLPVLCDGDPKPFRNGSGRLELAEAIVKQPLAVRVIVNRIWKAHMGTGIVDTPSNFGMMGERPSHPELLEYLSSSFAKSGMSMKKLHRDIMTSAVYQLGTENDEAAFAGDSGNRLYWRANRKRLDAEQLRDSVMLVSGLLDRSMGGPSADLTPSFKRRTVYGKVSRYKLDEYLQLFDFPSPNISAEKRFTTTVPLQRLFLMNSDFMQIQSEELAKRVAKEPNQRARIRKAYELVYGRQPNEKEILAGIEYLKAEPMLEYEERKKAPEPEGEGGSRRRPNLDSKPEPIETTDAGAGGQPAGGMMGGVFDNAGGFGFGGGGRRGPAAAPPPPKYEATAWGRYAKILLSSSEFLFVN